jgi:DNA-binding transcriptional regulator GbsR (MarR family)
MEGLSPERQYVEEAGAILSTLGMPPGYGKILAWLLICDPAAQSITEIAEATGTSKGSVSTAVRLLANATLVRRVARPGRRGTFYEMLPDAMMRAVEDTWRYRMFREFLDRGVEMLGEDDGPRTERIRMTRDFYAFFEAESVALIERFKTEYRAKKKGDDDG